MHPKLPPLTIDGTVLMESDDLNCYIWSDVWFHDDFWVSELLFKSLVSLGNAGMYSMINCFLVDDFRVLFCPFRTVHSAVWCSAADTHLKLLDRVVSGASFLTGCVFECDIAHRRSVAVLCMLYKIKCNPMLPLYGALPVTYVLDRVTSDDVIAYIAVHLHASSHHNIALLFP